MENWLYPPVIILVHKFLYKIYSKEVAHWTVTQLFKLIFKMVLFWQWLRMKKILSNTKKTSLQSYTLETFCVLLPNVKMINCMPTHSSETSWSTDNRALSWQNQQNDWVQQRHSSAWASVQSDQSIRCPNKKAWVLSYPLSTQRRLWSDWANAQADLSLRWAHMPFCWFCHAAAHIKMKAGFLKSCVSEFAWSFCTKFVSPHDQTFMQCDRVPNLKSHFAWTHV